MKKILFIEFWNLTPHLETALELAKLHCDDGDHVHFVFCGHDTLFQEGLLLTAKSASFLNKLPEVRGIELIASNNLKFTPRVKFRPVVHDVPCAFNDLNDLMGYHYNDFEAGLAVASSLVSMLGNSSPDLTKHTDRIRLMLESTIQVFNFSKELLRLEQPDIVYTFNGRLCNSRAVLSAARLSDVEIRLHETGSSKDRYTAYPFLPHDRHNIQKMMKSAWVSADRSCRDKIAGEFFINRRNSKIPYGHVFTDRRKLGATPEIKKGAKVVTYFSSSDDEFMAVGDVFKWVGWKNQLEAVEDLISLCSEIGGIELFIRLHPHLEKKSIEDQERWLALQRFPGVKLISFDSDVDTYAMIDNSDVVVSGGSTVGIEAVYWERPSICLGPSFYSELGVTYNATSRSELCEYLLAENLTADRSKTLPYGYYMNTFGTPFRYYKAIERFKGEFLGCDLQKRTIPWRVKEKLKRVFFKARH
jgi:hypothetical protein